MTEHTLLLLRHAKSDWSGTEPDLERPLAKRGRRQASEAGRWLATNIPFLHLAILSPAARVQATWTLVAAELEGPVSARIDDRVYAGSARDLLEVIGELPEDVGTVAMVGHNPGLGDLVAQLTGDWITMKTSAIAVIGLSGGWKGAASSPATLLAAGRPPEPL